jgi:hypothetical protein
MTGVFPVRVAEGKDVFASHLAKHPRALSSDADPSNVEFLAWRRLAFSTYGVPRNDLRRRRRGPDDGQEGASFHAWAISLGVLQGLAVRDGRATSDRSRLPRRPAKP